MQIIETVVMDAEFDKVMTGEEKYPVIGRQHYNLRIAELVKEFKGLPLYAGCYEKAIITQRYFGGTICLGSLHVVSEDWKSSYGFDYNPPNEFHAWIESRSEIIDLSLSGVILRGMKTCDEIGPILVGREPSLLFGETPDWIKYKVERYININHRG